MNKSDLLQQLYKYQPYNDQERQDRKVIINLLENVDDIFYRTNLINHISASSWIVNKKMDKILMCYHNIYKSYSWLGGHSDGQEDLLSVAIKEAKEESGITDVKALSEDIFSIEILTVDGHIKNGKYVNSHLHINFTYLLQADEDEVLTVKSDENSDLKWFEKQEALEASNEKWFVENIYSKLNEKLDRFIKEENSND